MTNALTLLFGLTSLAVTPDSSARGPYTAVTVETVDSMCVFHGPASVTFHSPAALALDSLEVRGDVREGREWSTWRGDVVTVHRVVVSEVIGTDDVIYQRSNAVYVTRFRDVGADGGWEQVREWVINPPNAGAIALQHGEVIVGDADADGEDEVYIAYWTVGYDNDRRCVCALSDTAIIQSCNSYDIEIFGLSVEDERYDYDVRESGYRSAIHRFVHDYAECLHAEGIKRYDRRHGDDRRD